MQIRVVTLRYNEAQQGFPEEALRAATAGRVVGGPVTARQDADGGKWVRVEIKPEAK